MGIGHSGGASHGPGAPPGPAGAASIGGRGIQGIQSGTGRGNVSPHGYAPTSKGSTAPKGPQGHAQPKATIKMDSYNPKTKKSVLSPEAEAEAEADVDGYFSKTDIFGDTRSDQVQYAKQNNLRNVTFHGDFGSPFGHVTGLAPHQSDNTPVADRTIPADPEGLGAALARSLAGFIGPLGSVVAHASKFAGDGGTNTGLFSGLNAVLGSESPFSRSTTTPTTSPTTSPKSSTTPVSVPRPKAKPQPLPKPPRQVGHGPGSTILEEEKKKGGRIKRKKNYSKGGGVRSARY